MEQRREPRFTANQAISVVVLGAIETRLSGRVRNSSGRGLGVELPKYVEPGRAVKIHLDDAIILGEAVYARQEPDCCFVGIQCDQALCGLGELARIVASFERASGMETPNSIRERAD